MKYNSFKTILVLLCLFAVLPCNAWAAIINGHIYDGYGNPVRGIVVYGSNGLGKKVSDRDGYFAFSATAAGTYVISPFGTMHTVPDPLSRTVTFSGVDVGGIDFDARGLLQGQSAISGIIKKKNVPVEGVTVHLNGGRTAVTDKNGIYTFFPLTPGRYFVTPLVERTTFSVSHKEIRLKEGVNARSAFFARDIPADATYSTYFSGLWDASLHVTSTTCPTNITSESGVITISQSTKNISVRIPQLGTFRGPAGQNGFTAKGTSLRPPCRVSGTTTVNFSDQNSGSLTATMSFRCLLTAPCDVSVAGNINRS